MCCLGLILHVFGESWDHCCIDVLYLLFKFSLKLKITLTLSTFSVRLHPYFLLLVAGLDLGRRIEIITF